MAALICFLVLLPSTTNAQRAAIGIGSKLKQAFGTRSVSVSRSENKPKTLQGEQEYDNNESDRAMPEKPGIVVSMLAFLSGYIYLFLQRQKIDKIEQAIAGEGKLVVQDDHMKVMEKMDLGFSGFKMELKAKKEKPDQPTYTRW